MIFNWSAAEVIFIIIFSGTNFEAHIFHYFVSNFLMSFSYVFSSMRCAISSYCLTLRDISCLLIPCIVLFYITIIRIIVLVNVHFPH